MPLTGQKYWLSDVVSDAAVNGVSVGSLMLVCEEIGYESHGTCHELVDFVGPISVQDLACSRELIRSVTSSSSSSFGICSPVVTSDEVV